MARCFSTRASVDTVLNRHSCISIYLWINRCKFWSAMVLFQYQLRLIFLMSGFPLHIRTTVSWPSFPYKENSFCCLWDSFCIETTSILWPFWSILFDKQKHPNWSCAWWWKFAQLASDVHTSIKRITAGAPLTSMGQLQSQHGYVISSIIKCDMKFLVHSQTSTVAPWKFGNG